MISLHQRRLLVSVLLMTLVFQACALIKRELPGRPSASAAPAPPAASTVLPPEQIRQQMEAGNYRQAVDLHKAAMASEPQNKNLVRAFEISLEDIYLKAEKAAAANDFAAAGKLYHLIYGNYPDPKGTAQTLSFTRAGLASKLEQCKSALYHRGFQEYRDGNLNQAIAVWQDYLSLEPDNADIQKALNTAKTQQKNLRP